jgi:hypothetical protein
MRPVDRATAEHRDGRREGGPVNLDPVVVAMITAGYKRAVPLDLDTPHLHARRRTSAKPGSSRARPRSWD